MSIAYSLEYGIDEMEMHEDAVKKGERVMLVDDLIATGGTAEGAVKLLRQMGAEVARRLFHHRSAGARRRRQAAQARRAGAHPDFIRGALAVGAAPRSRTGRRRSRPAARPAGKACLGLSVLVALPHGPSVCGRESWSGCSGCFKASGPGSWPPANFTSASPGHRPKGGWQKGRRSPRADCRYTFP